MAVIAIQPVQDTAQTTNTAAQTNAATQQTTTVTTQQAPAGMYGRSCPCGCGNRKGYNTRRRNGFSMSLHDVAMGLVFIFIILVLIRIIRG